MVMISKKDQDKVSNYILRIKQELNALCAFLGDIAHHSNQKGFLQVGDTVEVSKKAETPNKSSLVVVKRAKVASLNYRSTNLWLENVEMGASEEAFNLMGEVFDSKDYDIRKIVPGEGDDEGNGEGDDEGNDESEEDSSIDYYDDELNVDTDWWVEDGYVVFKLILS